tara:strand:- start:399 stop:617 length:219 start_codon:yes stop_codon:yes gene_type:complete
MARLLGFNDFLNENEKIESEADFKAYAEEVLKAAHPDDYDQEIADKTIADLTQKYNGDYGAMIGALTSGLGK